MPSKILMPRGGQTTNESKIVKWRVGIGDTVKRGDILFEIETDKATLEIESYAAGTVLAVYFGEGETVTADETVAYIGAPGEALPDASPKPAATAQSQTSTERAATDAPEQYDTDKVLASPKARSLAKSEGVPLDAITPGAFAPVIKAEDVKRYLEQQSTHICEGEGEGEGYYFEQVTPMRRAIARSMSESVRTIPSYYVSTDIDMSACTELRKILGSGVGYNDIIMKVAARTIAKYPLVNASYGDDRITVFRNVNFGLAVSVEGGLLVPVIHGVEALSVGDVAGRRADVVDRARGGKLHRSDMDGGTITLSNLGMYGADAFTAVIVPGQSCILAAGRIAERPVCRGGKIVASQVMTLTATFDHRLIDGSYGAAFLNELKLLLETPALLLV